MPHAILKSDVDWDPSSLDCPAEENEEWFDAQEKTEVVLNYPLFDEFVNHMNETNAGEHALCFFYTDSCQEHNLDCVILE